MFRREEVKIIEGFIYTRNLGVTLDDVRVRVMVGAFRARDLAISSRRCWRNVCSAFGVKFIS